MGLGVWMSGVWRGPDDGCAASVEHAGASPPCAACCQAVGAPWRPGARGKDFAFDAGDGVAARPDLAVGVLRDAHTSGAARHSPWATTYWRGASPSGISHCAKLALRLPVTGSSGLPMGPQSTHHHAGRWCRWRWGHIRTTPTSWPRSLRRAWSDCRPRTVSALSSSRPSHRGPLSAQLRSLDLAGAGPAHRSPVARQGGCVRCAARAARQRPGFALAPDAHQSQADSWHDGVGSRGWWSACSHAWQVPSVGWLKQRAARRR